MNDADIHELLGPAATRPVPPVAFSLDDVVRKGASVRRRRRAGSVAAAIAVVVLVVGGFSVLQPGQRDQPAAAPTLAEQRAGRVVDYALTIVPLPADAHAVSAVSGFKSANAAPAGPSVHRTVWYATAQSPSQLANWVIAHEWAAGWNSSSGYTASDAELTLSWTSPMSQLQNVDSPAPIVQLTVRQHDGVSIVRVDGWQRPQPVVTRDAATLIGPATSVAVARGSDGSAAYSSTLTLTMTGERAAALAQALDSLPVAWALSDRTCSAAQSTTFTFRVAAGLLAFIDQPACGQVLMTLNGKRLPALTAFDLSLKDAVAALSH